jgi:hypothetical protein
MLTDIVPKNCEGSCCSLALSLIEIGSGRADAELQEKNKAPLTVEEFAHRNRLDVQHVYRLCQTRKDSGAKKFGVLWRIYV